MPLIVDSESKKFDLEQIKKGTLVYAKHKTWTEGKGGFVTAASETEVIVQYHPGIANVTNHYFIPLSEVIREEWEIRWSEDLDIINTLSLEGVSEE